MNLLKTRSQEGPFSYENWKAALRGEPSGDAWEYPLYTDADIAGELSDGCGPYQFLNTVALPFGHESPPSVILRVDGYLEHDPASVEMKKTDVDRYHGGDAVDEIVALMSLNLGIRLRAGGATRWFHKGGDERGHPQAFGSSKEVILKKRTAERPTVLPKALGTHLLDEAVLLMKYPNLSPNEAVVLVRAARLYQDALWIAETEPELSWLMLVSAVESAAEFRDKEKRSPSERLNDSIPDLVAVLEKSGGDALVREVAELIADRVGSTRKFIEFILKFRPDPPKERPPQRLQQSWKPEDLKKSLQIIYNWRSRALHGGIPFPVPMCEAPKKFNNAYNETPFGLATSAKGGVWTLKDAPILLYTFEYIVQHSLLNWWKSMLADRKTESIS